MPLHQPIDIGQDFQTLRFNVPAFHAIRRHSEEHGRFEPSFPDLEPCVLPLNHCLPGSYGLGSYFIWYQDSSDCHLRQSYRTVRRWYSTPSSVALPFTARRAYSSHSIMSSRTQHLFLLILFVHLEHLPGQLNHQISIKKSKHVWGLMSKYSRSS